MTRFLNYRLYIQILVMLPLLFLTLLATVFVSGIVLTFIFFYVYLITVAQVPSAELLLTVLGGSMVSMLGFVIWEERDAPEHLVAATGATRTEEEEYPQLLSLVRSLSQQVDTPVPRVYIAPTDTPLSLTTGYRPRSARLIVSEGMIAALEQDELEAVVAHELAHIKNRDTAVMTLATLPIGAADRVITLLTGHTKGVKYAQPSRASYADALMTFGLLLVPPIWFCGHVLWASLSRTREFAADSGAVSITGNPASLVSALRRIDEDITNRPTTDFRKVEIAAFAIVESNQNDSVGTFPLFGQLLVSVFSTHPETATRIERLQTINREQGQ